mmetsp:Transcript_30059/g.29300  ORF Transcript_30059/g.29300 Transcript_30059/m.29300 type:complete len:118 (-) Transcript_30059:71-424(-)
MDRVIGEDLVPVSALSDKATYIGCAKSDAHIKHFWQAVESLSDYQRKQFMVFALGRPRLGNYFFPVLKIGSLEFNEYSYIPVANAYSFNLKIPKYPSYDECRDGLLIAISYFKVINY